MMKHTKAAAAFAGIAAIALAGCSRSPEEAPPPENMVEENYQAEPLEAPLPQETPTPEALPPAVDMNATAEALPPATTPSEDEQMADDAFATGMTARASRDQRSADEPTTDGNFTDR